MDFSAFHPSCQRLSPSRTLVTSFTPRRPSITRGVDNNIITPFEEGDWVLCLAASYGYQTAGAVPTISCALSNGNVQVYDQTKFLPVTQFVPHSTAVPANNNNPNSVTVITDLLYGPQNTLVSTGGDGNLVVTDLQSSNTKTVFKASMPGAQQGEVGLSVSLGFDGYLAAVGTSKGRVHFFDLRNASNVLGSYVDSHTDAVTQVKFGTASGSTPNSVLITGAEDGLACCFDTTQPTEEMALKTVMNVGAPLRKVGFCGGGDNSTIYCLTGSETASLWNFTTATCIHDFGGWNLREQLSVSAGRQRQQSNFSIDYLIDASWDESTHELHLAAGTSTGDAALFSCCNNNGGNNIQPSWNATHLLMGGHKGVVRAWCPLSSSTSTTGKFSTVIITAGEDARICEWNRLGRQISQSSNHQSSSGNSSLSSRSSTPTEVNQRRPSLNNQGSRRLSNNGGGPLRRQHRHKQSSTPY